MDAPRIGDIAHYVSYGTPGGEYTGQCRAAVVTEVAPAQDSEHGWFVGLCVLNPTGLFFNPGVPYDAGGETPSNELHCAQSSAHGSLSRYCPCGWAEAHWRGGTWHNREDCGR